MVVLYGGRGRFEVVSLLREDLGPLGSICNLAELGARADLLPSLPPSTRENRHWPLGLLYDYHHSSPSTPASAPWRIHLHLSGAQTQAQEGQGLLQGGANSETCRAGFMNMLKVRFGISCSAFSLFRFERSALTPLPTFPSLGFIHVLTRRCLFILTPFPYSPDDEHRKRLTSDSVRRSA